MLENVRGLMDDRFLPYRQNLEAELRLEGYESFWNVLNASDFSVPQLRPRTVLVALTAQAAGHFKWPRGRAGAKTVGETLFELMGSDGWGGARDWAQRANRIAPTLVGGSTKHGGPDLGPTRARRQWEKLGVDGRRVAEDPPKAGFEGMPNLTVPMTALLQGFPAEWRFMGKRTHAYRQVGNAFPPPVARAIGAQIASALRAARLAPAAIRDSEAPAAAA
jgi:DNA (cytosine-5)-methyltransferase 1